MKKIGHVEIAVIGAGIIGIATAYYLCKKYRHKSVVLIDSRDTMSYTSAQSGDNYRNWWPSDVMTQFTNRSIDLMREIADQSSNVLKMKQSGYVLATRREDIGDLLESLNANYDKSYGLIRVHHDSFGKDYLNPLAQDWASTINGVDVISNKLLINRVFPQFSSEIENVLHIRNAGDISGQQMGEYMLQQIKPLGCSRIRGHVQSIERDAAYTLEIRNADGLVLLSADKIVNAAGPYVTDIASMLGIDLPIENVFQQKIAFEDHLSVVPRDQPFSIDIDQTTLSWSDEERAALTQDQNLNWLTKPIDGGIHCRPEGAGKWIKLGWAYNRQASIPDNNKQLIEDPHYNPYFPEIVIRGAAKLNPSLEPYITALPTTRAHYGGYYTMTKENWPLIGPLDQSGAFIAGAMSGFGSMSACAAGSLCADWVCQGELPEYAQALSLARYQDKELLAQLQQQNTGIL
ncbi:MAG: glycine/D-amino acid oxidase-like deaminating enzyme [Arenicella sp.]|jgi:glycine/D-amino acid oxidase-like deaminating enzyme